MCSSRVGRPLLDVNIEDITSLRALGYTWVKIAQLLQISRSTLYRCLEDYGVHPDDYTSITSQELNEVVKHIKLDHPNDGEALLKGHLFRLGIKVPRSQLRASIHEVDHERTVCRRSNVIKRCTYSVPAPNAMWHVDGNHKLIRWRLVVHAGVDGFSRTIVYIVCANNNKATTVLSAFMGGVSRFGVPECVRSDHGGENVDVWRYMLDAHPNNESCVLTGSSTHNERIERMWRDVYRCVSSQFAEIFRSLESGSILDPLNEVDIFCLHFTFLPRINKLLREFQESWNSHGLSTEGHHTPYQLFTEGFLFEQTAPVLPNTTGGSASQPSSGTTIEPVQVPVNTFKPCAVLQCELQGIDPLQACTDCGKNLYECTIRMLGDHLSSCDNCTLD